jgi:hypothetical protein
MKGFKIIYIPYLFAFISCSSNNSINFSESNLENDFEVRDTLTLNGFLVFNQRNGGKFYKVGKQYVIDTTKFIKQLIKKEPDYLFVQPFEAQKYRIYSSYCPSNEIESNLFLKRIKYKDDFAYYFSTNEEFILLQNKKDINYLSFKCWKPYIKESLDK